MRNSIRMGIMFTGKSSIPIIDTERGEKADLVPLTMASPYRRAFQRRVRQHVDVPSAEPFEVWCARSEDVIVGKLMAWAEGRSRKHETDIREMMVYQYLGIDPEQSAAFDESYVDAEALRMGADIVALWEAIKASAREEAAAWQTWTTPMFVSADRQP
jgi:hypothetical protein